MKQRRWNPGGWLIAITWRQGFGIGFWWNNIRYNGVDFFLGPITLTIQPPMPKAWHDALSTD